MTDVVGFIGVGHLTSYLVEGVRLSGEEVDIVLSPRNRKRAQALAARFDVRVADSNWDVVAGSGMVILATRPDQVIDAASGLPWRADQVVVSVAAGVRLRLLSAVCTPAQVVRAMPVACAAIGESPTPIHPDHDGVRRFFSLLGPVRAVSDESSFEAASVLAAFYAWTYALAEEVVGWTESKGVAAETARLLVTQAMRGATGMIQARPGEPISRMLASLATPGGLTECGLEILHHRQALSAWREACEAALDKMRNNPGEFEE